MARTILHCDLNSFYASVELLSHPELRQQPVAVCGDPDSRKGIILAKNEPAKRFLSNTLRTLQKRGVKRHERGHCSVWTVYSPSAV